MNCGGAVTVPEPLPDRGAKLPQIEIQITGPTTLKWICDRCRFGNNFRQASLGSKSRCKGCRRAILLPASLAGLPNQLEETPQASHSYPPETPFRIKKLRQDGFAIPDNATIFDTWRCKQSLLRREVGLHDGASYSEYFEHLLKYGAARGGTWKEQCENLHIADVGAGGRYDVLKQCRVGDVLKLTREPKPDDFMAVSLRRLNNDLLGYIPSGFFSIAEGIEEGVLFAATLQTISARIGDCRTYFELSRGELIGDVICSYRKNPGRKFLSTLMANVIVYKFDAPRPSHR